MLLSYRVLPQTGEWSYLNTPGKGSTDLNYEEPTSRSAANEMIKAGFSSDEPGSHNISGPSHETLSKKVTCQAPIVNSNG